MMNSREADKHLLSAATEQPAEFRSSARRTRDGRPSFLFGLIALLLLAVFPALSQNARFLVPLTITNGAQTVRDTFGFFESATRCIDGQLDTNLTEVELGPPPPSILHARFTDNDGFSPCLGYGLRLDLRNFWAPDTFRLEITPPPLSAYPITVSWSLIARYGPIMEYLTISDLHGGTTINSDMLAASSIQIFSNSTLTLQIAGSGVVASADDTRPAVPEKLSLQQNYPNPFNSSTTIRYELPSSGRVTLTIVDQLGRRIRTLVDEVEQAGYHEAPFDASLLSSGEYFYTMRAGGAVLAKKLLLLR